MRTSKLSNKPIAITMGDPCGVGSEIIAKSLAKASVRHLANFIIIGDTDQYLKSGGKCYQNCIFVNPWKHVSKWSPGKPSKKSGAAALEYLKLSIKLALDKEISSMVTAPVSKEVIAKSYPKFTGHTEFLAKHFNIAHPEMMFVSDSMRSIIVTRHVPLAQVNKVLTSKLIFDAITTTDKGLKKYFKIRQPKIAVCGLNPHAGEGGLVGKEEIKIIIPAIKKAQKSRINVKGPFAADTLFIKTKGTYDAYIAMYHDQGLIAIKTLHFRDVVNLTLGLPIVRTSPAHGTAFDIAGKKKADPSSMMEAIKLAAKLSK